MERSDESEECPLLQSVIDIYLSNLILSVSDFFPVQLGMRFLGKLILNASEGMVFSLAHHS